MPTSDPRWAAAICVAAEAWGTAGDGDVIRQRLADELTAEAQLAAQVEADDFAVVAARVRAGAGLPTFADLQRRWAA